MSVTTRTNRATNPHLATANTGYAAVAGTGGTAGGVRGTAAGQDGLQGYYRVTWTAATTAVSGGASYTQTGLLAATQYRVSCYVRASKAQTVRLRCAFQNSSSTTVNTANSSNFVLAANTWTRIDVLGTSGAAVDRALLVAEAITGGSNWAAADTLDMTQVLIEQTAIIQPYFDGSYVSGLGIVYAWTGTAHASTSTAVLYDPTLTLTAWTSAPCARVEITINDLPPTPNIVTLWRTAEGIRRRVRSYEDVEVVGSDFTTDYEPPLNRPVSYEIEVTSGIGMGGPDGSGTVTVTPPDGCGYIQDPLNPDSAIKVFALAGPAGEPTLLPDAISKLTYHMDGELVPILGSSEPVALLGQRMARSNIPFDMFTDAAQQSTDMRNLLLTTSLLLIRPGADWGASLPGLCYVAPPDPEELPIGVTYGAAYTEWKFTASLVAAPAMNIVIPFWSYQDWQDLWATYQSAQTALAGKTYLAVRRSPTNGV
jgi:hypothetical protein